MRTYPRHQLELPTIPRQPEILAEISNHGRRSQNSSPVVDSNRAQMRAEHIHDKRLLTEHYLRQIASVGSTLMELQSIREQEIEQAQIDVDELEEQVEELEEEKRDWEEEKQDWEEEKEQLEERMRELEAERLIFTHNEEWSENRIDELEQEVQDLEQEKEDWEEEKERVEEERDGLENEKAELEERNANLERQVRMWKSRYEQAFAEKVEVESQYGVSRVSFVLLDTSFDANLPIRIRTLPVSLWS
ncbi:hypothetical protein QFC22_002052 [Naganishia vaughanmartiniae]|uniref:Uncharacterized protein n=1 Tax=Naganishia vaughanmartiniae TaxID=1424756 RepID=A0ACC2XFM2_9TREE|nr:hypothetical protein QFC22_002052 [Naganishia vaughanmartiniae]